MQGLILQVQVLHEDMAVCFQDVGLRDSSRFFLYSTHYYNQSEVFTVHFRLFGWRLLTRISLIMPLN